MLWVVAIIAFLAVLGMSDYMGPEIVIMLVLFPALAVGAAMFLMSWGLPVWLLAFL
jgi:hypothetical protein